MFISTASKISPITTLIVVTLQTYTIIGMSGNVRKVNFMSALLRVETMSNYIDSTWYV